MSWNCYRATTSPTWITRRPTNRLPPKVVPAFCHSVDRLASSGQELLELLCRLAELDFAQHTNAGRKPNDSFHLTT